MRAIFRFLMLAFLAVTGIAGLMAGSALYLLVASIPDYSEEFSVTGLSGEVEILRDASAVPHISGTSASDIYFALGFAHAQDRLGQLLRMRRSSSEQRAQLMQEALPMEVEAALTAYSNGINAWISEISRGGRGRGAPESLLSRSSIVPWTPSDSLAIAKNFLIGVHEYTGASIWREEVRRQIPTGRPDLPELDGASFGPYLRTWGIPAARTVSGQPIILADIAGPLSLPAQWYLADLRLPSGPVIGATLPGVPMVVVGRSDRLVWGVQSDGLASTTILDANEVGAAGNFLSVLEHLMKADDAVQAIRGLDKISIPALRFVIADRETLLEWPMTPRQPETPEGFQRLRSDRLGMRQPIFSLDGAVAAQQDTVSEAARTLLPFMAREFWFNDPLLFGMPSDTIVLREQVLALLARWNGDMNRMSPEPLIYWTWVRALQRRVFEDEFPTMEALWGNPNPNLLYAVLSDRDGAAAWCDVLPSERLETCQDAVGLALNDALNWITERYGDDPAIWYWGAEHELVMEWSAIRNVGLVGSLVSHVMPVSGGPHTQKASFFDASTSRPFETRRGSNFQAVMSLANANSSRYIIPAGQSGHPLSRFYDNFLLLWTQGEYLTMTTDIAVVSGAAAGLTRLFPARLAIAQ